MAIRDPNNIFEQIVRQDDGSYLTTPAPAPLPDESRKEKSDPVSKFLASPSYGIAPAASKNLTALNLAMFDPGELGLQAPEPVADSTFGNAFQSGLDNMSANWSYFKMLLNDATGDTEAADENLAEAQRFRGLASEQMAGIEGPQTWEELMEAPSFGGALTYALSTTGQFAPSAMASITMAMIGAATAAILPPVAAGTAAALVGGAAARETTKQSIKRTVQRAIKNKVKGEKNKATDELLDATWAYMKKVGPKQFWQTGAKHRAVMGGVAGAFTQEFTQGSGILYGDFAEQGMRGPREAGLSVLGGTAYGLIGTAGEAYVVGAVKDTFFNALKNVGSKSYFRNVAAGAGGGLWRGAVGEGAAEFGQEGVSIVQKFNIDDEYTRAMARSDAINALMAGAIGGGIIGGAGGTVSGAVAASVPAISRKSGEYVDKFSRGRVEAFRNKTLDQEELGANLDDLANEEFNSTRESAEDIHAQYLAMKDPNTKKEAMWISYGKEGKYPNFTPEIEKDIKEGKLFRVDTPNMGVMLTTREDWANELKELIASNTAKATVYPEDPETGQTDMLKGGTNLDFFLANVLGYSAVRQPNDGYVVEVVDKQGNPVHFQSTSEEGHDAAVAAAKTMFEARRLAKDIGVVKLGKGQDYMFYQDFHNQRNPKDNSLGMRTVETHLIERNNKRKDTLIDQMSTIFEEEALTEEQAEVDDTSGLAEDKKLSNASISYELGEGAIARKRFSEIRKGKKAKVKSWSPSAKASTRAGYGKTLEQFKNVIRGRDPVLTEQDFNNISLKVAEDMNTAAEKLAKQRGISQKEALSLIEEKVRTPKNWDKEKMVGKGKKEVLSEEAPSSMLNEEAELAYNNDPEVTTISEQNLKDMRENHIRTLQKGKKSLLEARAAAKEAFPDSLVGQPILTVIPKNALDKIIQLSRNPDFDANTFEIVIAEESTEADIEDSAGSEFVESDDSIGRIVINVVSEDPSKTLSLVQDKQIVEYALAKSLELGRRVPDGEREPGIKLDLRNILAKTNNENLDSTVSNLGVEQVLQTQLMSSFGQQFAMLSPTQLVMAGLNIMKRNGFDPVPENLTHRDDRLRYYMHGFTTILEQLGSLGYDIVAHREELNVFQPEITYSLVEAIETTFPEVVVATTTENPAQLDAFDLNAEENAEKLVSLNAAIQEEGKNLLDISEEAVVELEESNNLENSIKEKLKTWLAEDKGILRFKISEAESLLTQIEKRDQVLTEMKNYKTGREQIDEAIKNPEVSPSKSLPGISSLMLWNFLKKLSFYSPSQEKDAVKIGWAEKAADKRKAAGLAPKAAPSGSLHYTLGDFIGSFDKDPISGFLRRLKTVKGRLAQRFFKKPDSFGNLEATPQTPTAFLKQVWHPRFNGKVDYSFDLIREDKINKKYLEKKITDLGFEKSEKGLWVPTSETVAAQQLELLEAALNDRDSKMNVDATVRYNEAVELYGETLQNLQQQRDELQDKIEKWKLIKEERYKTAIKDSKKVLKKLEEQITTIERIFEDPTQLNITPSVGLIVPQYELQTKQAFNVGTFSLLSAKEGIKGTIKKLQDVRTQYEQTGKIVINEEQITEVEGKKAEKYIENQKRLRLFKFGKKGTTKKTKTMPMPFVPIAVPNFPWTWEAEMAEKYWEPVGEIKPDPKYRNREVLEEKEIKALEKQLKQDGKIILGRRAPKVVKNPKAAIASLASFNVSDGKLFFNGIEVEIEETEVLAEVGSTTLLPTTEFTKLNELSQTFVTPKDAKILQDNEKYAAMPGEKHTRKGPEYVAKVKYRKDQKAREQRQNIMEWESANTLNLSEMEQRTVGSMLPGQRTKKYLPNFSSAFLEQLNITTKKLGLEKILKGGGQNYMDTLFATVWSSFNIDPKVRTLVISSNENIDENPALKNVDSTLKNIIKRQQSEVDRGNATLSKEELAAQRRGEAQRLSGFTTKIKDYGNNVFGSRIRVQGGRENIIILKIGTKKGQKASLTRSGFLFSISKAFGHEVGHLVLDAESDWTNNIAVIFKNHPIMLKAYETAIADPNAPAEWKDERNGAAEWFADNFSLAFNEKMQPKTGVESMFKRLAEMFRKAWENIANYIKARFDVDAEGHKLFKQEINNIIKEHKRRASVEAADPNRWNLTTTEAWIIENMKTEIMTWEDLGGQRGAEVNKTVIKGLQDIINGKMPNSLAFIIKPADNFLRHHIEKVGLAIALKFYGKSQSGEQQGFLQIVTSEKNHLLTGLAKIILEKDDADWGMLQSNNPDLLAVEDSRNNTYEMEKVPSLTFDEGVKHAKAHPEFIYLHDQMIPKGYENTVSDNMYEIPRAGENIMNGFFRNIKEVGKQQNKRGFIIIGNPQGLTKNDKFILKRHLNSLKARKTIPKLSGKKPPKGTTPQDWAWWENRYVFNIGTDKFQLTGRQFKLRQFVEQFYWEGAGTADTKMSLQQKGVPFRENYWPRMYDFVEIGAKPELREKLINLLVEGNTKAKTRFRREITVPYGSKVSTKEYYEGIKSGKYPGFKGGVNKTYGFELIVDKWGRPITPDGKELEPNSIKFYRYFEFFDMDKEYATQIVDKLADGPQEAFQDMINEDETWIGHELGLGVLPHRAKAFAALDTAVLRKEGLIVDPAIAMDRSLSQLIKKIVYDIKGGWKDIARLLEEIEDPAQYERAKQAVKHLLGKYDQTMSPQFRTFNSWALFMNISSLLAFATFASFPDFAGPILRSKEFRAFREVVPLLLEMAGNPTEARRLAKDIGVVASEAMELMWIHSPQMDWQTHGSQRASSFFFKYTGLEAFTKFTRYFATGMGKRFLLHHAERAKNGKGLEKARSIRYLKELNNIKISEIMAAEKAGWNLAALDADTSRRVRLALVRFVDESIVRPSAAERPTWASDPRFALIWQLKSFFYAYGKNIVGGTVRESISRRKETGSSLAMVPPLMLMAAAILPLTMLGWDMRERTKYAIRYAIPWQTADWDKIGKSHIMPWPAYWIEAGDRSGALGPWTMVRQMYTKAQWQEWWLTPLLGPTAEKGEDFLRALFTDANWQYKKNLPLGQLAQYD